MYTQYHSKHCQIKALIVFQKYIQAHKHVKTIFLLLYCQVLLSLIQYSITSQINLHIRVGKLRKAFGMASSLLCYDHQWMRNDMFELALASGARGWTNGRVDCSLHSLDNCVFSALKLSVVINDWTLLPHDGCIDGSDVGCILSITALLVYTDYTKWLLGSIWNTSNTSPVNASEKRFSQPQNISHCCLMDSDASA